MSVDIKKVTHSKVSESSINKSKNVLKHTSDLVIFSYKYLSLDKEKFNVNAKDSKYFCKLKERLRDISKMKMDEMLRPRNPHAIKFNSIKWDDPRVTEKNFGIPNEEEVAYDPREFSISVNEHGRVHGFCIDNIFYIVWFDPEHNLIKQK